jgi:general secretion pathway protein G
MVVISIIGLLATIVAMNLEGPQIKAHQQKVRSDVKALDHSITLFHMDMSRWPSSLDELVMPCGEGWTGPYIEAKAVPKDPWKREYVYRMVDDGSGIRPYSIGSFGADGTPGGVKDNQDIFPMEEVQ